MAKREARSAGVSGLDAKLKLPAHAVWCHWAVGSEPLHRLEWDITIHSDPGNVIGEYFAPFNGYIGGYLSYGGIQTNVQTPQGPSIGKGVIFSTWSTFDAADGEIVSPDGFMQLGTHEGKFLGVRRPYNWSIGHLRFSLARTEERDRGGHWFECVVQPLAGPGVAGRRAEVVGAPHLIGKLRYDDVDGKPPCFSAKFLSFLEIYSKAKTYGDIVDWHLDVMAYGNGMRAEHARVEYCAFPHKVEVPNVDAWYDESTGRVNLRFGNQTVRTHEAAELF